MRFQKNGQVNEFVGSIKKFNIMKRKKEENEKLIDNIKTHVRRVLMKQGKYSPEMSYQIELLASDLLVFRKIRNMVLDEEQKPTIVEITREKEERIRENPIYNLMAKFADRVRKDLRSLKMNKELPNNEDEGGAEKEEDALRELMDKLKEEEE